MADVIERDAVLARIDCCLGNSLGGRKEFDSGLMQARKFVISTPAVNRWISVEDALPEEGTRVIAVVDGESREAIFSYNAFHGSNFYRDQCDIEWWMPMPDASRTA